MRRKLFTLLVATATTAAIAMCITGCSGDSGKDSDKAVNSVTTKAQSDNEAGDNDSKDEEAGDTDSSSNASYATYEDFTMWDNFLMTDIYVNYPYWGEQSENGGKILSKDINDFAIVFASNYETPYTGEIENILEQTYPEFMEVMREEATINRDINPSDILTAEKVTFENGIEAMKFEGVHPGYSENWGPYPVFGYSFVYENVNITIGYVLDEDTPELREEYEEEIQDVVYRIITTIRVGEE